MEAERHTEGPRPRRDSGVTSVQVPLDVVGEVQALVADETIRVTAREDIITVDLPNLWVGVAAFKAGGARAQRAKRMRRVSAALQFTDLNVQFQLGSKTVARLGPIARPGLLSRWLGVGLLEIRVAAVVSSLLRALRR